MLECVLLCITACFIVYTADVSHTGRDLVLNEALQSIQFGFSFGISNHTVQRSQRVKPDRTHFSHLKDEEQEPIGDQQHSLIQ